MKRRVTKEEDIIRLAERVFKQNPGMQNRADFNTTFDVYMDADLTKAQNTLLRNDVFDNIRSKHRGISPDGKEKRKEKPKRRLTKAQRLAERKRDVKSYKRKAFSFEFAGRVRNKVVFLRKATDKRGRISYRDSKGRFGSVTGKTLKGKTGSVTIL